MGKLFFIFIYIFLHILPLSNFASDATGDSQKLKYNLICGLPDVFINPDTEKIGHTWSNGYVWDKPLIQKFYSLLPTNDFFVAIDLGAQTGSFSLLAKYFPNSRWYSFEPIAEAAMLLGENLKLNDIHNVSVYQMAVTDFSGYTILKMPTMNAWGLSTIGTSHELRFVPVMERKIPCISLDNFIDANCIQKVHFMKLDTEGSELHILRGAKKMIMRDHPIIIMEYHESNMKQCNVRKQDIDDLLTEMGYQWTMASADDILCIPLAT